MKKYEKLKCSPLCSGRKTSTQCNACHYSAILAQAEKCITIKVYVGTIPHDKFPIEVDIHHELGRLLGGFTLTYGVGYYWDKEIIVDESNIIECIIPEKHFKDICFKFLKLIDRLKELNEQDSVLLVIDNKRVLI